MTEIEQAIKYWEKFKQESVEMIAKGKDRNDVLAKQVPMCDIALAALREQAEREKGCFWCLDVSLNDVRINEVRVNINCCPMCGRRLEAQHE